MESKIDSGLKMVKSQKCNTSHTKTLLLKVQGLQNRAQNGVKIGSKSHLRRGDPQNASREALGAFLEASGAEKKKLGTALGRLGPQKGAKIGGPNRTLKRSKMPLGAQEAPRGCRGAIFDQF